MGVEPNDRPQEVLTVPLDMVRGSDAFVLRAQADVPRWQIGAGDYLIMHRRPRPGDSVDTPIVVQIGGEQAQHLRKMRRVDPDTYALEAGDGSNTLHPDTSVRVVGVLAGVIRKY
jgi:SOS-response transcriptional repressor LexA